MPGTSRAAMPAILATTPSAMLVFPLVSAGAAAPVRSFSAVTLCVLAITSIGRRTPATPAEGLTSYC